MTKAAKKQAPRFVVTDDPDRKHVHSEVSEIVDSIGAPAGNNISFFVTQDKNRRFAGNARDFSEDKFVGHHVAENGDCDSRERLDDLAETVGGVGDACQ